MNRIHSLGLVFALISPGLVAGCGKKAADSKTKAAPTAPTPAPTAPAPAPTAPTPAPAAATDGLKLPEAARPVGMRWAKNDELSSTMHIGEGDKQIDVENKHQYRDELEVVEADASGMVTKIKVAYPTRVETEEVGGKAKDKRSPLAGNSYVVWVAGGKTEATHADGSAVSQEELEELTGDHDDLGKPEVMEQIMARRTWKVGETYAFTADDLAALAKVKATEAPASKALSLTLKELAEGRAIFEMKTTMALEGKLELSIEMTGLVQIDIKTGRPMVVDLSGPAKGVVSGMPVTGNMSGKIVYEYPAQ